MKLPLLYPILDADVLSEIAGGDLLQCICEHAQALAEAGCTMMQYRAKHLSAREALAQARELRRLLPGITLIMNDRADLCLASGFDGVHVGQSDLSPEGVRVVVGAARKVGLSTHTAAQMKEALTKPVDYVAIGPVFGTRSKLNPDPLVGLAGVEEARHLRDVSGRDIPLVAIGGISRENAGAILRAGADSIAVIGDICRNPRDSAREFFRLML